MGAVAVSSKPDPQRPSVDRDAVDSFDAQAHRLRKGEKGVDREVAQVLVVDRVVLQSVEELADVRHFDNDGAPRPEKRTGASEKTARVVDVREHVVGHDCRCVTVGLPHVTRDVLGEELIDGFDTSSVGQLRDVACRLDAEDAQLA